MIRCFKLNNLLWFLGGWAIAPLFLGKILCERIDSVCGVDYEEVFPEYFDFDRLSIGFVTAEEAAKAMGSGFHEPNCMHYCDSYYLRCAINPCGPCDRAQCPDFAENQQHQPAQLHLGRIELVYQAMLRDVQDPLGGRRDRHV